ncbi:MAG: hypothetical protein JNN11_03365 [Candidatus Doudnabacteria bacterium]|nr:hypothetical protein [Candidatus Doudnabacteria bacterium]
MQQLINSTFSKALFSIIALIIMSASFCSMAAMKHEDNTNCMVEMTHDSNCNTSSQSSACLNFHLGLMEKFSHGFADNLGFKFLVSILTLAALLYAAKSLFTLLREQSRILKVRLRQLSENVAGIFQDVFGNWLSLFEKRDPSYAFATA